MIKNMLILSIALLGFNFAIAQNSVKTSDSKVNFEISNMGFKTVDGNFTGMTGTINFNPQNLPASSFDVCIDASTVNTENEKRDHHLKEEDFFHVEKYPKICFKSSSIAKSGESFTVTGTLTMHGVSKTVTIPFTYSDSTFKGKLTIDRYDYKVGSDGGFMVGREVMLEIICVI
ncbi:YceI family protein [bacterium SCSIO 12741]|nr:YceI family protein [bacterium SCSIO 12741]